MLRAVRLGVGESRFGGLYQALQLLTPGNHAALWRGPGPQAAAQRAYLVIGIRLLCRNLLHTAFDAYLPLQRWPEEGHCSKGVGLQLLALGAVIVGEEGEPLLVEPLQQQYTAMRATFAVHRGQGHGVGFHRYLLGFHRIGEPLLEQGERLPRCLGFGQAITGVVAAHIGQGLGHYCGSLTISWSSQGCWQLLSCQ